MKVVRYTGTSDVRLVEHEDIAYTWSADNDYVTNVPETLLPVLQEDGAFEAVEEAT